MKNETLPFFFVMISLLSVWSCKPGQSNETSTAETPKADSTAIETGYPALGNQEIALLYSQAEKVDIIFYKLPISVNQEDPASVKNTVLYVSPASPKITAKCEPVGRLTWMAQGKILREADVYCDTGCEYFVFMENNKPAYTNAIGMAGVAFFKNVMSQVAPTKK